MRLPWGLLIGVRCRSGSVFALGQVLQGGIHRLDEGADVLVLVLEPMDAADAYAVDPATIEVEHL